MPMKKRLLIILGAIVAVGLVAATYFYKKYNQGGRVPIDLPEASQIIQIPTGSTFEEVLQILTQKGIVEDPVIFSQLADYLEYRENPMRPGRFKIEPGISLTKLVKGLQSGKQATINVVLTNERLLEDVAAKVARFIESDSLAIINMLHNDIEIAEVGYTRDNLMSLFIPNTYNFFWNTSPEGFLQRMVKEHDQFWKAKNRLTKAKKLGLSTKEVYTLASIVEKETLRNDEKRRMAGVYYNRLQQGMRLQADPTAVFATRDFDTPRVLNKHINFDSPFNTYKYKGLPPGPITMTSISSIDAVLNVENHDYVYFCAKGDGSGYHNFAKSLEQHNINAATYVANLKKRGLR